MSDPRNGFVPRRDWKLIVAALLALAFVIGVIAYKYTGDFTGFAKFNRDSVDFFIVRALDETHGAVLPSQIAGLA